MSRGYCHGSTGRDHSATAVSTKFKEQSEIKMFAVTVAER